MRQLAREVVRLTRPEDTGRSADRELDASSHHHTAFFPAVDDHLITGAGPRSIPLMQDRELAPWPLGRNQPQRDFFIPELDQLIHPEESLRGCAQVEGEELGQRHWNPVQHLLEGADRGAHAILLDEGNQSIGHPRTAGQLALRDAEGRPNTAQPCAYVNCHETFRAHP